MSDEKEPLENEELPVLKGEDLLKEIVKPIVSYAMKNPTRMINNVHILCGTKFTFFPKLIKIYDKKRNIKLDIVYDIPNKDFKVVTERNGEKKLKKLLNSDRWKSAIEGIDKSFGLTESEPVVAE